MTKRNVVTLGIAAVCVGGALLVEWLTTPGPQDRHIRIEAFRYGATPSIIRASRGDRLDLTFASRDTAHSFFLQDYNIDAKMSPEGSDVVELYDPRHPEKPPTKARHVELTAGPPGPLGHLISVSRHRCHVYCGPMHGFEQGDLIVRPNWLFAGALGGLLAILVAGAYRARTPGPLTLAVAAAPINLSRKVPGLQAVLRWRPLQFYATLPVLGMFVLAILAGLVGTKVGGRNFSVMATWVVWMFIMAVVLVPFSSRAWCTVCPLPVLGEYLQRGALTGVRAKPGSAVGNSFLGLGWKWPRRLRGTWLRQLVFLCIGTLAASFAGMPRWTALMLLSLIGVATVMGFLFERRAFCRFVCPVT
ncbi:MAG: hypothetical protein HY718_19380, partial [Planctomycetes bacterium]|nr:hypothetical protein [Planctomycetota bacterium]